MSSEVFNLRQRIKTLETENKILKEYSVKDKDILFDIVGRITRIEKLLEGVTITVDFKKEIKEIKQETLEPRQNVASIVEDSSPPKYPKGDAIQDVATVQISEKTSYNREIFPGPLHEINDFMREHSVKGIEHFEIKRAKLHQEIKTILPKYGEGKSYFRHYIIYLRHIGTIALKDKETYIILLKGTL